MPGPERAVVDWSAFQALVSGEDRNHRQAKQVYEALLDQERELWTTSFVLLKTIGIFDANHDTGTAGAIVDAIRETMRVFWIESSVHDEAWKCQTSGVDPALTYLDWTTFVSARRLRAHVFGYNDGFARNGLVVLP